MNKKEITYAAIIPLIGGEPLGVMNALDGQLPEYVLSWSPFGGHDELYTNYLRTKKDWKGDYVVIDNEEWANYVPKQVDVVMSTCPCAGLSSLSTSSSADSAVNDWLYTSAEYVLSTVKPKVFWGENAPRLYSNFGKPVADKLFAIGQKYGYSLNLYYTESKLHGNPQKRPRTFYFFTKSETAPIFKTWRRDVTPVEEILAKPYAENDSMNVLINKANPVDNAWVAYAIHATGAKDIHDLYNKFEGTQNLINAADKMLGNTLTEVADWMDANGHTHTAKRARAMQKKVDSNLGYWSHGVTLAKGIIPSFIGAMPGSLIDSKKGTFLTLRDGLRFMGMPEDFEIHYEKPVRHYNKISQNVPVFTAQDMMMNVIDYLNGNCDFSDSPYFKQSNKNYNMESVIPTENTASMEEFMS